MARSISFESAVLVGTVRDTTATTTRDMGNVVVVQSGTITATAATTYDVTITLPASAQILDIVSDTLTTFTTSGTLTVGITAGGTEYLSSTSVATAGRTALSFTGAQLTSMNNISTNTTLIGRYTAGGTAGSARLIVKYSLNTSTAWS